MESVDPKDLKNGDQVYVIYRNPHVPSVANVKEAEIVPHPRDPNALALFINETFHVIEDDDALFATKDSAERAYHTAYEDQLDQYH